MEETQERLRASDQIEIAETLRLSEELDQELQLAIDSAAEKRQLI